MANENLTAAQLTQIETAIKAKIDELIRRMDLRKWAVEHAPPTHNMTPQQILDFICAPTNNVRVTLE